MSNFRKDSKVTRVSFSTPYKLPGICLLRNLYAGQEATVRTGHGTTDWFQIGKGVHQGCVLSPCLFNLYAEYIMRNTGLEETQTGIKIAWRIPGMREPGGLLSLGSHRVRHDWSNIAAAAAAAESLKLITTSDMQMTPPLWQKVKRN